MTQSAEYQRGYDAANARMLEPEDAKHLRFLGEIFSTEGDDYNRGWIAACDEEIRMQAESDAEWERIEKLTPEEVKAELFSIGYTQERLDASFARLKETLKKYGVDVK